MKKFQCPYCAAELSTHWDDFLINNELIYKADFNKCILCKKEFRLFVIRDKYLQVVGLSKREFKNEMYYQKMQMQKYGDEQKDNTFKLPNTYKVYLRCISDSGINQEFGLCKVVERSADLPVDAIKEAYFESASSVFEKHTDLEYVDFLGYVLDLAMNPSVSIQRIRNKPFTIKTHHSGFTMFDQSHTSPLTFGKEVFIQIARQEAPFLFPDYSNLGFLAYMF